MSNSRSRSLERVQAGGFTLLEVVIVVAIIAISAAIAIPAVQSGQHQRQVRGTLQGFVAAVREASSKAVLTRKTVEIWVSPKENDYAMVVPLEAGGTGTEDNPWVEEGEEDEEREFDEIEIEEARKVIGRVKLPELATIGEVTGGRVLQDDIVAIPFYPTGASGGAEVEFNFEWEDSRQSYVITIDPLISTIDLKGEE